MQVAIVIVVDDRKVHGAPIVPDDKVVSRPAVSEDKFGLIAVLVEEVEQQLAFLRMKTFQMGGIARVDKEAFAPGVAMGSDHGMHGRIGPVQVVLIDGFVGETNLCIDRKIVACAETAKELLHRFG